MEWQQLEYFQTLARVQNFTRAADELALTQSALSRSIAKLEEEMGVPLFERKVRGVVLNRYGEILLPYVNRAMQEITLAKQEIKDLDDPYNGSISLAFIHTLGSSYVPELIGDFREKFPGIEFALTQDSTRKIMNLLEAGEIELGFCSPNEQMKNKYIEAVAAMEEQLFLIVPKNHRLADRTEVQLREVADEPFVSYKHESGIREVIDTLCQQAGFKPKVTFEGVGDATIAGFVAADFGVALIPFIPGLDMDKISLLTVTDPNCKRTIQMVWRSDRYMSPALEQFKRFIEDRAKR
ncbi:LysR family transcriptional regulator [Brevibacillus invocatus]|uniref:LysR family transcriptional regulator n=1 Tax=Brevibacillus invocatus TaxID=173959 RepID=A0A3M8CKB4_9BACL|nr:LysR family transcriptional regulator [Brevibacillus invocatus]MCM3078287.1 LysR family transcriptional regulator [Brevibacillus invocatus]MCM3428558.1 LysR family transcriptional regulator [Brevibacillus invocatus]RNB76196.1 LysR family transcriptional regulator [Brevibacillus invocatus]